MNSYLVFSTVPDKKTGQKLARALVKKRLAACAHLAPKGASHYWWKGKLERADEMALTFKTTKKALPLLMQTLKQLHPYETPEILAVRVAVGNAAYLRWLCQEVHSR